MLQTTAIQPLARDVSDAVRSSQAVSSPAQAALELVYNALDAGATEVVVALDVGALSITVRDNGRRRSSTLSRAASCRCAARTAGRR